MAPLSRCFRIQLLLFSILIPEASYFVFSGLTCLGQETMKARLPCDYLSSLMGNLATTAQFLLSYKVTRVGMTIHFISGSAHTQEKGPPEHTDHRMEFLRPFLEFYLSQCLCILASLQIHKILHVRSELN